MGLASVLQAQELDSLWLKEIKVFQAEQDEHYFNKKTSPLNKKERKSFKGHHFFPVDIDYCVEASFHKIEKEDTVAMQTSSGSIKYYKPYAYVRFMLKDTLCELTLYQSYWLRDKDEYKNYLLMPFTDATSGKSSYGGGRYLDIEIPSKDTITLNFNLAYNPYCAYTSGYNCTIPPRENRLNVHVLAGLAAPENHD